MNLSLLCGLAVGTDGCDHLSKEACNLDRYHRFFFFIPSLLRPAG